MKSIKIHYVYAIDGFLKLNIAILSILLSSCIGSKKGGSFPVYKDEYVLTTESRFFELEQILKGRVILNQISYPCINDNIIYNATTIIKLTTGDTLTVYTPCDTTEFKFGDNIKVTRMEYEKNLSWTKREIFTQFPKKSKYHPYYLCRSCKYENTIGKITLSSSVEHP